MPNCSSQNWLQQKFVYRKMVWNLQRQGHIPRRLDWLVQTRRCKCSKWWIHQIRDKTCINLSRNHSSITLHLPYCIELISSRKHKNWMCILHQTTAFWQWLKFPFPCSLSRPQLWTQTTQITALSILVLTWASLTSNTCGSSQRPHLSLIQTSQQSSLSLLKRSQGSQWAAWWSQSREVNALTHDKFKIDCSNKVYQLNWSKDLHNQFIILLIVLYLLI